MLHSSRSLQIIFRKVSKDTLGSESLWIFRKLKIILTKIICASKACFTGKINERKQNNTMAEKLNGAHLSFSEPVRVKDKFVKIKRTFQTVPHCIFFFLSLLSLFIVLCWFLANDRFVDHQTKIFGIRRYNKILRWQIVISTDQKVN